MGLFDDPKEQNDENNPFSNPLYGAGDPQLDSILGNPDVDYKTRQMAQSVKAMEDKARRAGLDPAETEPRNSFFMDLLDTLDAPRQGVAGVLDAALRGDIFTGNVGTGWRRGQTENTTFSDILRRNDAIENPIARGVVGFAGDVLMDPLTYLSFGTSAAAKVGGRALTKTGLETAGIASNRLLEQGVSDIIEHSDIMDQAFTAVGKYQEAAKEFENATSPTVKALAADQMAKFQDAFQMVLKPEEVIGKELFETPKLRVGANIPFLGHLTGGSADVAKETLVDDVGPVGQALRLAGKVWKPGKVHIGDFDISPALTSAFENVKHYANGALEDLGTALGSLEDIPILGGGVTAAKALGERAGDAFDAANKLFRKIFYQKSQIGADANTNRLNYVNLEAGARRVAVDKTMQALGEDIVRNKDLQKEIYLAIDGQAFGAMKDASLGTPEVLDSINRIRAVGDVSEGDQLLFRDLVTKSGAEQGFRQRIDNVLLDPNVAPEVKEGIQRTMSAMDNLAMEESRSGLGYTHLEYYVPHRYLTVDNAATSGLTKAGEFLKARKYDTIADAFNISGKVADTNLASLLNYRFERSAVLQAQRSYAQRLMLEESLNPKLVKDMYKESLLNPGGEAAQALKRYRINAPEIDMAKLAEGQANAERQMVYAGVGLKDPVASRLIAEKGADFQQKVHQEMWAAGVKPLDAHLPQEALGELASKVSIPGGGEMYLPTPIANAYKETIAARDILKDAIGASPFGKATLKAFDSTVGFFKKWTLLPWPGYWAQNFIGDRFNQAMAGVHAYNPGIFARTHSLLSGKSSITNKLGMTLDKPALDRIVKELGINYSARDYLSTVDAFGDANIEKMLAGKNSLYENIKNAAKKPNRQAALAQIHQKFQNTFDGFFRVSHFVHRFEQGDSVSEALRAANDVYFNYKDLSQAEQSIFRRFYMFYGYMSKATKQTVSSLISRPGNLTMQLHGVDALAEFFSSPDAAPTVEDAESKLLSSAVMNEQISRIIGKTPEGRPIRARGFAAPLNAVMQQFALESPKNLSVEELINTAGDSARRTIQKQFATANPAINAVAQIVSGKNLYFDRPLNSEFLRKLPSLNAAAERLAGFEHDKLPLDLDAPIRRFLKAVPDGKGRLIADPARMWILVNLVPGMSRAVSTGGAFTNVDIPLAQSMFRAATGINIDDSDPSRSYLANRKDALDKFMIDNSANRRLQLQREEALD